MENNNNSLENTSPQEANSSGSFGTESFNSYQTQTQTQVQTPPPPQHTVKHKESKVNGALIFSHITNLTALALVILYFLNLVKNLELIEYFVIGLLALSSLLGLIGEFRKRKIASLYFLFNCATLTCLIVLKAFFK